MYTVGQQIVPMHVLCGTWWEILKDGERFCVIVGNQAVAQRIVDILNQGVN